MWIESLQVGVEGRRSARLTTQQRWDMKVSDSPLESMGGSHEKYVGYQLRTCADCPDPRDGDCSVADIQALCEARE